MSKLIEIVLPDQGVTLPLTCDLNSASRLARGILLTGTRAYLFLDAKPVATSFGTFRPVGMS